MVAAALTRNRLQQKDVAAALGVSRMTVFAWFHGKTIPTGTNLLRLVEYLRQFEPEIAAEDLLPSEAAPDLLSPEREGSA